MTINLQTMEADLRTKICPSCMRYTSEHRCSLPAARPCSLFKNLAKIVDVVRRTHSREIGPYLDVLRDQVCATCHFEDDHGACPLREGLDCALDVYFPMIVDEIEAELARQTRAEIQRTRSTK